MDAKKIEMAFLASLLILGVFNIYMATNTAFLGEDEATYVTMGEEFSRLEFSPYTPTGRHNMAPPFVPLSYASVFMIFGISLEAAKAITAFFGILTILAVYLIGKKVNVYVGILSACSLMLMSFFSHMSLLAYVDVPTAFFSAFFILVLSNGDHSNKKAVLLGAIMGVSYFVKVSTFFLIMIFGLYVIYNYFRTRDKNALKFGIISIIVSMLIITPYIIRNIIIYNYPYFIILDTLFPSLHATGWVGPGAASSTPILNLSLFLSAFEWFPLIIGIFSLIFVFSDRGKTPQHVLVSATIFTLFMAMFIALYMMGKVIAEPRYLMIIFPQLAVVSGYFLWSLKERSRYMIGLVIIIAALSIFSSLSMTMSTESSQRFPDSYVTALHWIRDNTPRDALVFTTYSGSVNIYAQRENIWTEIKEFADIMTTDNATYIRDVLKSYNVSYVELWSGVIAETHFIPNANLAGVFSYQFVNTILNSPENFNVTYQNENNAVLKVL